VVNREQFKVGDGIKHDEKKPRWHLIPLDVLEGIARVATFGADKYEDNNWKYVHPGPERYFDALMRHITAWQAGERDDPETGFSHLAHAGWNVMALAWFEKHGRGLAQDSGPATAGDLAGEIERRLFENH
jgi:hypothetical protein